MKKMGFFMLLLIKVQNPFQFIKDKETYMPL